jgi:hypothetical protein
MATQAPLPLTDVDMAAELHLTVHHLSAMLRTVRRIRPNSPQAQISAALELHLKNLKPADLGLPEVWSEHAARIEARAIADAHAEGLAGPDVEQRSA